MFQAARILAKLSSSGKLRMSLREQKYYLAWLIVALNNVVGNSNHSNFIIIADRFILLSKGDIDRVTLYLVPTLLTPVVQNCSLSARSNKRI